MNVTKVNVKRVDKNLFIEKKLLGQKNMQIPRCKCNYLLTMQTSMEPPATDLIPLIWPEK